MQPIQSTARIILAIRLLGATDRRNDNKPEIITTASPIKNDQRLPIDKIARPPINKI